MLGMGDKASPDNEITRYHFFELIIRIALQKYSKTKKKVGLRQEVFLTPLECFHKFVTENIMPNITKKCDATLTLDTFRKD